MYDLPGCRQCHQFTITSPLVNTIFLPRAISVYNLIILRTDTVTAMERDKSFEEYGTTLRWSGLAWYMVPV